jgi:hypothetical protein
VACRSDGITYPPETAWTTVVDIVDLLGLGGSTLDLGTRRVNRAWTEPSLRVCHTLIGVATIPDGGADLGRTSAT